MATQKQRARVTQCLSVSLAHTSEFSAELRVPAIIGKGELAKSFTSDLILYHARTWI